MTFGRRRGPKNCDFPPKHRSAQPPDHGEPRLWPALAERDALQVRTDLEPRRVDLLDGPDVRKRLPKLPLGDPPRALGAGLLVVEAQEVSPVPRATAS